MQFNKKRSLDGSSSVSGPKRSSQTGLPSVSELMRRYIGNWASQPAIAKQRDKTKLATGAPDDIHEHEADQMTDAVMGMPAVGIQRELDRRRTCFPYGGHHKVRLRPVIGGVGPRTRPESENDAEEEMLKAKFSAGSESDMSSVDEASIQAFEGGGRPLSEPERAFFEPHFGFDFSAVRVHSDRSAAHMARRMNARSFTFGRNIAFGAGQYAPGTRKGRHLLAHELAHVVQQQKSVIARRVSPEYPTIEDRLSYSPFDWAVTEDDAREVLRILAGLPQPDLADTLRQMEADDIVDRLLDNISDADRAAYSSLFVTIWQSHVPPHSSLADKAAILGGETITMNSYRQYQRKHWIWFFSPNTTLDGRAGKPLRFDTWDDWNQMHWQSKQVIADLAGLDASRLGQTSANLATLKTAYASWQSDKFAVFQSGTSATNTCNVFLGDALFLDGKNQTTEGKYYSAEDVYDEEGRFTVISPQAASRGDIAAWGNHVEIVTSVDHGTGKFCSRGGYREPMGDVKCGRDITAVRFVRIR